MPEVASNVDSPLAKEVEARRRRGWPSPGKRRLSRSIWIGLAVIGALARAHQRHADRPAPPKALAFIP